MDDRRFDTLSRTLADRRTRRTLLTRAAIAIAGGVGAASLAGGEAHAARATCRNAGGSCTRNAQCCSGVCLTGRDVPRGRRNRCFACPADTLTCGATCCPAGSACIDGACVTTCTPTVEGEICLLSARAVIQAGPCLTIMVGDGACIDDADCSPSDFLPHEPLASDRIGCMVSWITGNDVNSDYRGFCMSWTAGPGACPP